MATLIKVTTTFVYLLSALLFSACSHNQDGAKLPQSEPVELPKWTWPVLEDQDFKEKFAFNVRINPFYLQADFDKDGFLDIAILIKERKSGKAGLVILRNGENQLSFFGAGQNTRFGGENWYWLRTWKTETILPGGAGVQPAGAILILFPQNKQQPSPWIFWNGVSWQYKAD